MIAGFFSERRAVRAREPWLNSALQSFRKPPRLLHGVFRITQELADQAQRGVVAVTLLRVLHAQHRELQQFVALAGAAQQAGSLEMGQWLSAERLCPK
jgi:hypothetical protein